MDIWLLLLKSSVPSKLLLCNKYTLILSGISVLPVKSRAPLVAQRLKRLPAMRETRVRSLGREDPEVAIHSSILAWRIPWTEKPSRLQFTGSQRVGHD